MAGKKPRNVRNFWVEGRVDGKASPVAFGPKDADGGMSLVIKMRHKGEVKTVAELSGVAGGDGETLFLYFRSRVSCEHIEIELPR